MPCRNYRAQLSLYAGGELDPVAMLDVGRHVQACPSCRTTTDSYRAQRASLGRFGRGLGATGGAPDLFSSIAARLPESAPSAAAGARRPGLKSGGLSATPETPVRRVAARGPVPPHS
jgi:anti-sigma factor RsiW